MSDLDEALVRARTWVLLAIDACDRAGLVPISKIRFHRMIFLSNCLAEIFQASPPVKRVLKYKRGPFYPDVQWQLDRLTAMGLINISDLLIEKDDHGPWMEANYLIARSGIDVVEKIKTTPLGHSTSAYIDELVFAFARLSERNVDQVALNELNYVAPGIAVGALISFEDAKSNIALRKTEEFERLAPEILVTRFREQIQLYLRYIEAGGVAA
jgi:hypothetical protein